MAQPYYFWAISGLAIILLVPLLSLADRQESFPSSRGSVVVDNADNNVSEKRVGASSLKSELSQTRRKKICESLLIPKALCGQDKNQLILLAHDDDIKAQLTLGGLAAFLKPKDGSQENIDKFSNHWLKKASENGSPSASFALGWKFLNGDGLQQDLGKALLLFNLAFEKGFIRAAVGLSSMYSMGLGVERSYERAAYYAKVSAESGDRYGLLQLGYLYSEGTGVEANQHLAFELFQASAQKGTSQAQHILGLLYESGMEGVVKKDAALAAKWLRRAAETGEDAQYMYNWAKRLSSGDEVVAADPSSSREWMKVAAEFGSGDAYLELGIDYMNKGENELGLIHLKKASDHGSTDALFHLGFAYEYGMGVDIDPVAAVRYYRLSAEAEDARGKHYLGRVYERGWGGVSQDLKKALDLFESSADDGYLNAFLAQAAIYKNGIGVTQDLEKALRLSKHVLQAENEENRYTLERSRFLKLARVEVAAIENLISEKRKQLSARFTGVGNFYALIIGNDNYENLEDLTTPVNDARWLAAVLEQRFGYEVQLLENATRSETLRALSSFRRNLSKEDNLLVYYAGHGVEDEATKIGYWQPTDAVPGEFFTAIKSDSITDEIGALEANNVLVVADSCFAGAMVAYRGPSNAPAVDHIDGFKYLERLYEKRTRLVFTSGGVEPVVDVVGEDDNSIFAEVLIGILESADDVLTATDLYQRVRQEVIPRTLGISNQTPQLSRLVAAGDAQNGDFLFVPLSGEADL
ncbi:caspase family protein [Gammaproteobacteria bacterium]|nr:caspase family protein [Gammaproteobacteria bacterium]